MSRADLANTTCSLSRAVERVGEPWTLMILRECFLKSRRFEEFQRLTGASPYLLSQRLKQLCADDILTKRLYCEQPKRYEYILTEKGRDLWPVIMTLKAWGDKWLGEPDAVVLTHKGCGKQMVPQLACPECGEPMCAYDCRPEVSPELQTERTRRLTGTDK